MAEIIVFPHKLSLGTLVRIYRNAHHWTQQELADISITSQTDVSALERDHAVYPAAKKRILEALGIQETGDDYGTTNSDR